MLIVCALCKLELHSAQDLAHHPSTRGSSAGRDIVCEWRVHEFECQMEVEKKKLIIIELHSNQRTISIWVGHCPNNFTDLMINRLTAEKKKPNDFVLAFGSYGSKEAMVLNLSHMNLNHHLLLHLHQILPLDSQRVFV